MVELALALPERTRLFQALVSQLLPVVAAVVVRSIQELVLLGVRVALLPVPVTNYLMAGLEILLQTPPPVALVVAALAPPVLAVPVPVRRVAPQAQAHLLVERERRRLQRLTLA